ncbi:MAG: LppX_LprAFG lipoprotein [Dermatophilaceae bacterium]
MHRRLVLTALALSLPVSLAACGGSAKKAEDPTTALSKAKTTLDTAKAVTIDLKSSSAVPTGHNGVSAAKGTGLIDATTPKFKGKVSAVVNGTPATVEMVGIGEKTWMSFFSPKLTPIDMADLGAPDPALLFKPDTGLASMLGKASGATMGTEQRYGKEVLQTYTAKVPGQVVVDLLHLSDAKETLDAEFEIEPTSGQLRVAKLTGVYYEGEPKSTYTVVLTDYGKTIDIAQP